MKIALVTTPPTVRSGIGDYTRHLLPYLRVHCDVELFAASEYRDPANPDLTMSAVDTLRPAEHDHIVYQLGNEIAHAFMMPMVRALGGTVVQHDWVLFDMTVAGEPKLARGGLPSLVIALKEGGPAQARVVLANWRARRAQRRGAARGVDAQSGRELGEHELLLDGWHDAESSGRWTNGEATFRLPIADATRVVVSFAGLAGRTVTLKQRGTSLSTSVRTHADGMQTLALELGDASRGTLAIETTPTDRTAEQRRNGDSRQLGSFIRAIEFHSPAGAGRLDLSTPAANRCVEIDLSRDRFRLPLNHSIVRCADSFIVHSQEMKRRILEERNALTPTGIVHHGAERRWRDEPRQAARARLGLPEEWQQAFLVVSFGNLQRHKRIDKLLMGVRAAVALRDDVRLCLVGEPQPLDCDVARMVAELGLERVVRITGYLPEAEVHDYLHAADVCVNLRGPSTGGTSGGVFQALAFGRAVIASDDGEQSELPSSCVLKVPTTGREVELLGRHLVELRDQPALRAALEASARAFVDSECHWSITAAKYYEHLEQFPRPRSNRRHLLQLTMARLAQRRRERAGLSKR